MAGGTSCISSCICNPLHGNPLHSFTLRLLCCNLFVWHHSFMPWLDFYCVHSLYLAWKLLHHHDFICYIYIVCPKCDSIYEYHEPNVSETNLRVSGVHISLSRTICSCAIETHVLQCCLRKFLSSMERQNLFQERSTRKVIKSLNTPLQRPNVL